ncbi:MAG: A24 family peptidase [Dongiaceae bacterium]
MLAMPFISQIILLVFGALLIAAAREDIRSRLIPNRYCLAIALLYPVFALSAVPPIDWLGGLIAGSAALLVGYVMFAFRLTGGGDAKLFAAVMLWAGPKLFGLFVLTMALFGGVMGIVFLIRRRWNRPASAQTVSTAPLMSRIGAAVTVFFGNMLLARASGVGAMASGASAGHGSDAGDTAIESRNNHAAESLPYGVAIAVGGLAVAATLLMKG